MQLGRGNVRYGEIEGTGFKVLYPRFERCFVGHARVERLWTGARWFEGPAWFAAGRYLDWSDIPNNRMLRWDEATGAVDVVRALSDETGPVRYDEAVSKYFLGQYVRQREGYLDPAAEDTFRLVSILSAPAEQRRWADLFRGSNPDSPQNLYGRDGEAVISIRAIGFINDGVANVRFHRTVRQAQQTVESDWIATIAFTYTRAPMSEPDRLRNPLGFQVTSYRADPEVIR